MLAEEETRCDQRVVIWFNSLDPLEMGYVSDIKILEVENLLGAFRYK